MTPNKKFSCNCWFLGVIFYTIFLATISNSDALSFTTVKLLSGDDREPQTTTEAEPTFPNCDDGTWPTKYFHNKTQKCYPMGSQGPCPNNLRFFQIPFGSIFGDCDCPQKGEGASILEIQFPNVYHKKSDSCHQIYTQAFCHEGQWLTFNKSSVVQCVQNPCVNSTKKNVVFLDGQCVSLGSSCGGGGGETTEKNKEFNKLDKIVKLSLDTNTPFCALPSASIFFKLVGGGTLKCGKGLVPDAQRECREVIE